MCSREPELREDTKLCSKLSRIGQSPSSLPVILKPDIMPGQTSPTSPSWSASIPTQPFHFRLRTEPIDWRRMAAMDVDRVERETDINVLQEFISAVTFCTVESERCPQCRCPIDITLLNVLRMSQFSTEYLLHCQEYLSSQVAALEERLQRTLSQTLREEEERARLEKELQEVKLESRRRKKLISTQQLLLQSSANNYHKCQFCEKSFVNYSYLQSHVQRRHPEITDAERHKKMQVEQMKNELEELKEKLRLTQSRLEAERESDVYRRQQEMEEQRRKEASDREIMERCKEEEKKTFNDKIDVLRMFLQQEFEQIKSKIISIEAKLHELESRERNMSNLRGQNEIEKEQRRIRERELKEQMKNKWKKKIEELQNRHQQEKVKLEIENNKLQKASSVKESTISSVHSLKQQVQSLSNQLRERETLIHSQKEKLMKLMSRSLSESLPKMAEQNSADEEEEEEEEEEEDVEVFAASRVEPERGTLVQNFRPIIKKRLQKRLEMTGIRKGTKGISAQTFKRLMYEREQTFRSKAHLHDLRFSIENQLDQRVRELQRSRGNSTPSRHTIPRKKLRSPVLEQSPKLRRLSSKHPPQKRELHQTPTAAPRSKAPAPTSIRPAQQKKSRTPPFSSEEEDDDESGEDSAYITSSRDKPSTSVHLTSTKEQQRAEHKFSWSDSNDSDELDTQKPHGGRTRDTAGSVDKTLTKSLEKQLSITKPVGGIRVLPPASQPSPRPSIIKQQAVSDEESDLDLSSIEELTAPPTVGRRSSDVAVTSGTSVWSSAASRAGAW
ncbi:cilium assembly protein DZIP1L-like isoform X2 [Tachysurus fulvidraco]|uniref:cilium assembly protein DZIP1L-like isoform X2 n=1 Tax=Tachysurus fulvidraco TaxID=1234273 RepID=UPI001FEE8A3A|nr:cilium assembly protein DZIP1L-like isoform X2 [Tachysurus fulvidraco]